MESSTIAAAGAALVGVYLTAWFNRRTTTRHTLDSKRPRQVGKAEGCMCHPPETDAAGTATALDETWCA
jgi:hypothetical protein